MQKRTRIILWSIAALIGLVVIISTLYLIIMNEPALEGWEAGDPDSPKQVLIAASGSDYKKQLIRDVIDRLQSDAIFFKVIGLKELPETDPAGYQAIAILNSCEMYKMDEKVRSFLKKYPEPEKIVLLVTSGNSEWTPEDEAYKGYNAISGASSKEYHDTMLAELTGRIRQLLQ